MFVEKTLSACRDCGQTFIFSIGEQESFAMKGFTNEPSRCPECRAKRRQGQETSAGGFISRGYTGGNSGSYERQMYPAVCSECGKNTQVPFQPRNDKPVYCSECFAPRRISAYAAGGDSRR